MACGRLPLTRADTEAGASSVSACDDAYACTDLGYANCGTASKALRRPVVRVYFDVCVRTQPHKVRHCK